MVNDGIGAAVLVDAISVVAGAAAQDVIAGAAFEVVVTGVACEDVGAGAAVEAIGELSAREGFDTAVDLVATEDDHPLAGVNAEIERRAGDANCLLRGDVLVIPIILQGKVFYSAGVGKVGSHDIGQHRGAVGQIVVAEVQIAAVIHAFAAIRRPLAVQVLIGADQRTSATFNRDWQEITHCEEPAEVVLRLLGDAVGGFGGRETQSRAAS